MFFLIIARIYSCHATTRTHHTKHKIVIKDGYLKSYENLDQYRFVWVWHNKVWYKAAALTKNEIQRRFPIFDFTLLFFKALSQDG